MVDEYCKNMVTRDGRTALAFSPTEKVDLESRGFREADAAQPDAKPMTAPKAKTTTFSKGEDVSP